MLHQIHEGLAPQRLIFGMTEYGIPTGSSPNGLFQETIVSLDAAKTIYKQKTEYNDSVFCIEKLLVFLLIHAVKFGHVDYLVDHKCSCEQSNHRTKDCSPAEDKVFSTAAKPGVPL